MTRKIRMSVTVDPVLLRKVTKAAKTLGISRSEFVEKGLVEVLQSKQAIVALMENEMLRKTFLNTFSDVSVLREVARVMGQNLDDKQLSLFMEMNKKLLAEKDEP